MKTALIVCGTLFALATPAQAERADRNKPMQLEADHMKVDEKTQTQVFSGDVKLQQGSLEIRADRLTVAQDKQGFQRGVAHGKSGTQAWFRQKRDGRDEYVEGQADRIEYDGQAEIVDFYGNAKVRNNQDEASGPHLRYSIKTETFSGAGQAAATSAGAAPAAGRVRMVIQPKNDEAAEPKAR